MTKCDNFEEIHSIFARNLPYDMTSDQLLLLFKFSEPISAEIAPSNKNKRTCRGYGWIHFSSKQNMERAMLLDGTIFVDTGKELVLKMCDSSSQEEPLYSPTHPEADDSNESPLIKAFRGEDTDVVANTSFGSPIATTIDQDMETLDSCITPQPTRVAFKHPSMLKIIHDTSIPSQDLYDVLILQAKHAQHIDTASSSISLYQHFNVVNNALDCTVFQYKDEESALMAKASLLEMSPYLFGKRGVRGAFVFSTSNLYHEDENTTPSKSWLPWNYSPVLTWESLFDSPTNE